MADSKAAVAQRAPFRMSVKLSRRFWLILGVGILVMLAAVLWYLRNQQVAEQKRLTEDLATVNSRLAGLELDQLSTQQNQLRDQIAATEAKSQELYGKVATPTDSISASGTLYGIAQQCSVVITAITASEDKKTELAGIDCHSITFGVTAEGSWSDLTGFVSKLKSEFATSLLGSATFSSKDTSLQASSSVNINLTVYTLEGKVQ